MELEDCCYEHRHTIKLFTEVEKVFKDANYAILCASMPRLPG